MDEAKLKKEIRYCDFIVFFCFICILITRFATAYVIGDMSNDITGAEIKQITTVYEGNPIAKMIIDLSKMQNLLANLIIPAMLIATYLYFRRRVKNARMDLEALVYFVNFSIFCYLLNVFNDVGFLLGRL